MLVRQNRASFYLCFAMAMCLVLFGCGPTVSQVKSWEDTGEIASLTAALKSEKLEVRMAAAAALAKIGLPALNPLIEVLDSKNLDAIGSAAWALGEIGDEKAINPLVGALKYDYHVRESAQEALIKIGNPTIYPLIEALKHKNENVRESVADILGEIGGDKAVLPLINLLEDKEWVVRKSAVKALGNVRAVQATDLLVNILQKNDEITVQWAAAEALGKIKDARATDTLLKILRESDDERLKWEAAIALGKIEDSRALKPLLNELPHASWRVRMGITSSIGKIGKEGAVGTLITILQSDNEEYVRMSAAAALGEIADAGALEPLIAALDYDRWRVRIACVSALGKIKTDSAIQALEKTAQNDPKDLVRKEARDTLAKIKAVLNENSNSLR